MSEGKHNTTQHNKAHRTVPYLELLLLRRVLAFPYASRIGLASRIRCSTFTLEEEEDPATSARNCAGR